MIVPSAYHKEKTEGEDTQKEKKKADREAR